MIKFSKSLVKITDKVWKIKADSNLYYVALKIPTVIDTGNRLQRQNVIREFPNIADFTSIKRVILTHLHYDHIGNFDLFENAEFFASKDAIKCVNEDPWGTILNKEIADMFKVKLKELPNIPGFEFIPSPGHTKGSICILYEDEGILFSGDTVFGKDRYGRVDLPTSIPEKMNDTLKTLSKLNYKILCPGHDYCLEN